MTFVKRPLSTEELAALDFSALGVETRRVPPLKWDWAVYESEKVLFTQLISSSAEMREGLYWYLLLAKGEPYILKVDDWGGKMIGKQLYLHATIERPTSFNGQAKSEIERLASDAMHSVSVKADRLFFAS